MTGRIVKSFQDYDGDSWLLQPGGLYKCTTAVMAGLRSIEEIRAQFGPLHHINYKEA